MTLLAKRLWQFLLVASTGTVLWLTSPNAHAETIEVEYKSFYSHVNKLKGEQTQALQFAFGFVNVRNGQLCQINEARISTEKQQIPLEVSGENRFTVPSDKVLRLARAMVVLDLKEAANICDMSVQLETKPEYLTREYSQADIQYLFEQYSAFFEEMGGFLSFMMPKVVGLKFYLDNDQQANTAVQGFAVEDGVLSLNEAQISSIDTLRLPSKALRITAITNK